MTRFLLCLPLREDERGALPPIPPGAYVGFFDAADRRLVFVHDPVSGQTNLYLSSEGWERPFDMRDDRLPETVVLAGHEAAWAVACWKAVRKLPAGGAL